MYRPLIKTFAVSLIISSSYSFAGSEDDNDWVRQCMKDNKHEGQVVETVMVYCHCMNENMSESEEQSITEWEQSHPNTAESCAKKAGWEL
jgi:hypothetical protein